MFKVLPMNMHHHFIKYSFEIRLLLSSAVTEDVLIIAQKPLCSFVKDYQPIYFIEC